MSCKQDILNMTITSEMMSKSVKTFTMSKRLTRTVMRASILNILHQRLVLNQSDLKTRLVENVPVVVFKRDKVKDPLLRQYLVWAKGISDAIDKNYLKEVFLFMKKPGEEEPFETYKFLLKYNMDEGKENVKTSSCVKQATMELMQVINLLGKNEKLSEETDVQVELTYFETTPNAYEPPGFHPSYEKICMQGPQCNVHLGTLKTGFHKLSCYGGGEVFTEQRCELTTQGTPVGCSGEAEGGCRGFENVSEADTTVNVIEDEAQASKAKSPEKNTHKINMSGITISELNDNISIPSDSSVVEVVNDHFFCLCQLEQVLDVEIVECVSCKKAYHAPCQGYVTRKHALRSDFVCVLCDGQDAGLKEITVQERPLFCRIRLVLYYMDKRGRLPVDILNLFPESHRNIIMEKINSFKLLTGASSRKVDQAALKQIMCGFFEQDDSQVFSDA